MRSRRWRKTVFFQRFLENDFSERCHSAILEPTSSLDRFSSPPILGPYFSEQSVRHHYFGKRGFFNIGLRDWSATLSLLNKVCNSIYYKLDLQSLFGLHVHSCTHWLRPRNPSSLPIWAHLQYDGAILISQDRRHLFVTPWRGGGGKQICLV